MKSIQFISLIMTVMFCSMAAAEGSLPIIDMHLHSYSQERYVSVPDLYGTPAPADHKQHFDATYEAMRSLNVVLGVVSGSRRDEEEWLSKDTDGRLLRGAGFYLRRGEWSPESFEAAINAGEIRVWGEVGPYYEGKVITDPAYAPYLDLAEQHGIPLALHTGGGPVQTPYRGSPDARLTLSNPFLIEDVLVQYPRLKVYLMHSGVNYYEEALRLMLMYPRVHSDLGVVLWVHELPKHYGEQFLRLAKKFGMLDRVMFGSDQMMWPHAIGLSIDQLNSFDFLTDEEKRDILYNNAARFLNLSKDDIERHHGRHE